VNQIEEVPPQFHARHSAIAKTYEYRIFRGPICPPFLARYVYHHPYPLDESEMQRASTMVIGGHDFTSFAAADPERGKQDEQPDNIRMVTHSAWRREDDLLIYQVCGDGFLHHMVRNLVGTFLLVGKKSIAAESIPTIIHARNRSAAGPTAPAGGLFLVTVDY
jgi:tRNA pseudouridine38-40 synthase